MDRLFRNALSILLLPFAAAQAYFYEVTGRPFLPFVGRDPGPESQQLLPENQPAE